MSIVMRTRVVKAPITPTWAAVSTLGAVEDWHPNVALATVLTTHDSGISASRRVEFHDGNSVVETVVEESEKDFTKVKMTESPMLKEALITIRTEEHPNGTTEVSFTIDYGLKFGPIGWLIDTFMMKRIFRKVFDVALEGLSFHLETGRLVTDSIPAQPWERP